jgi:hypothetical protein
LNQLFQNSDKAAILGSLHPPLIIKHEDKLPNTYPIPWECLYDQEFWGIKYPIYRHRHIGLSSPLKLRSFLLLADPDESLPAAHDHVAWLLEFLWLQGCYPRMFSGREVTSMTIKSGFGQAFVAGEYQVIYYAGHFRVDEEGIYIPLSNGERIRSEDLTQATQGPFKPLIFFNACLSATAKSKREFWWDQAKSFYAQKEYDEAENLLEALKSSLSNRANAPVLKARQQPFVDLFFGAGPRVSGFVGTNNLVVGESGFWLAERFFEYLLKGGDVAEILRRARKATKDKHPLDAAWCSYLLYGQPLRVLLNSP